MQESSSAPAVAGPASAGLNRTQLPPPPRARPSSGSQAVHLRQFVFLLSNAFLHELHLLLLPTKPIYFCAPATLATQ